jgi:preprotein translocase SecE subunit
MKTFSEGKSFLKEVKVEFGHVSWLTKKEVTNYTLVVVVFSLALYAFLGFFDFIFNLAFVRLIF